MLIIITIAVVALLIIHPIIPIPIRINTNALEIRMADPYHIIEHEVVIRGFKFFILFTQNRFRFRGSIEISGHPRTHIDMRQYLNANHIIGGFGQGALGYFVPAEGEHGFGVRNEEWYGTAFFRPMFREMTIKVHDNGASFWGNLDDLQHRSESSPLIVLRATSREDAVYRAMQSLGVDPTIVSLDWWQ